VLSLVAALAATLAIAAPALADGDPASDYLITQPVFLPFESKVSETASKELQQLLVSAKEQQLEVRVALIGTRADLGAIPMLYRKPQRYADFLGQELVYYYKGLLLIVMPNGYGLYRDGARLPEDKQLLAQLQPPGSTDGNALAVSAENAVRALAERRGLTLRTTAASSSSGNRDRVRLAAGAILLCAVALAVRLVQRRRRTGEPGPL
jgi:hypothetical protein